MRTILENLQSYAQGLQRNLVEKGERRYSVEGDIVFEFTPSFSRECSTETLRKLRRSIQHTDEVYPWRDKSDYDGSALPSIQYLGEHHYQYHNVARPELHVWFKIVPSAPVRKGQIHAYEKYLEKLAEELSKQQLDVTSVRSVFRASSVERFKI